MAVFPGEPGLAGFIAAKNDRSGGGDNRSYKTCKAPVKSTNQRPAFYRPDAFLSPTQQGQSTERKQPFKQSIQSYYALAPIGRGH